MIFRCFSAVFLWMSVIVPVPSNYASDPEVSLGFMSNTQRKKFYSVSLYYFLRSFFVKAACNTATGYF